MKYVAFLRGVNVKGTTMKMAEVCAVFEKEGMQSVVSVLATGNIIFESDLAAKKLRLKLQTSMSNHFDYDAFMFIKTEDEVKQIFQNCPFEKSTEKHNYVFVTEIGVENVLMDEFLKTKGTHSEQAQIVENTFYWQVEKGATLNSKFGKILGKKSLKDQFTSRNINTFEKIINNL